MNTRSLTKLTGAADVSADRPAPRARSIRPPAAARAALRLLEKLHAGTLELHCPDGHVLRFGPPAPGAPDAVLQLHDWSVCAATMRAGDIGFAESYMAGSWTSPDLAALLGLFLAHRESFERAVYGSWWGSLLHRVVHLFNRNTRAGSRRNIAAHYDLGNTFYALWLDPSMNYSSAWFDGDTAQPLQAAQHAKVRRAIDATGIRRGQRLLEIGCGWGAVAESAARFDGAKVVGVTLSASQLAHARTRLATAGLSDLADLRLQDYRDIADGPFDAIVSIEMFEAVGRDFWPAYFETVHRQLKPGGRACIQTIVIRDDLFTRYARSTDFIQRYIFPGGMLPSRSEFSAHARRAGLRIVDSLAFGRDYAETLRRWRAAFEARLHDVRAQGFDESFARMWRFYLAYCEAAFDAGTTDVLQFTLERP